MKKLMVLFTVIVTSLIVFTLGVSADSPINSTEFFMAYLDESIVEKAAVSKSVDAEIAAYLSNIKNPIDKKAAVINAISWDGAQKNKADTYSNLVYKLPVSKLKLDSLSGDQLMCIGYLLAMDDTDNTKKAVDILKKAQAKLPNSMTVALVYGIVDSQNKPTDSEIWKCIDKVISNNLLKKDMNDYAVNLIVDYMSIYSNKLLASNNNFILEANETKTVYVFGTSVVTDSNPYKLEGISDNAATLLSLDENRICYVEITGIKVGSTSISIKNSDGKKITINFNVVSKDTYTKLSGISAMYIGSPIALNQTNTYQYKNDVVPYVKNKVTYVPVNLANATTASNVSYDKKSSTYKLVLGAKSITFKPSSNIAVVNGKNIKLKANAEVVKNELYIPVEDYASFAGKQYTYYSGLIVLSTAKSAFDINSQHYMLNEISNMICNQQSIVNYPTPVAKDGKVGYQDKKGKLVVQPTFIDAYEFSDGFAQVKLKVNDEVKNGFIDSTGKLTIQPIYDWAGQFSSGLAPVGNDDKYGFVNAKGIVTIPLIYDGIGMFGCGIAPVCSPDTGKWGYINTAGKIVIPYTYDNCLIPTEGMIAVQKDSKWGYVALNGKLIIDYQFEDVGNFENGLALVKFSKDSDPIYINKLGQYVLSYENGDSYIGETQNGLPTGVGMYTWSDGEQYIGDIVEGNITGNGMLVKLNGDAYKGGFKNGSFEVHGIYYWQDGSYYEGGFKDGNRNGSGKYYGIDGSVVDEVYENGQLVKEKK